MVFTICALFALALALSAVDTLTRVRLSKAWKHEDEEFDEGDLLDVDKTLADDLIAKGVAVFEPDDDGDDDESDDDDDDTKGAKKKSDAKPTVTPVQTITDPKLLKAMASVFADALDVRDKKAARGPRVVKEQWTDAPGLLYGHKVDKSSMSDLAKARCAQKELGQWLIDLHAVGTGTHRPDRLDKVQKHLLEVRRKALGSDEYAALEDTIGGFFIQPDFDDRLLTKGFETEWIRSNGALLIPTNASLLKINAEVDKDRQTDLYGGVNVFFQGERQALTAKRGKFEQIELKPDWLTGLYFATDHLLRSAPAIGAVLARQFRDAFQRRETLAFLSGSGAGEPRGVLGCPAEKVITRETTNEINHNDVVNMMESQWDRENSVWIAPQAAYSQLANMAFKHIVQNVAATENVGGSGQLTWMSNFQGVVPNVLLGRPIIFTEHAPAPTLKGGLMLISWRHYIIAESTDMVSDSSIHVRFDSMETAFRFARRLDGQPWWRSTLTTQNAFVTSPFIILAA